MARSGTALLYFFSTGQHEQELHFAHEIPISRHHPERLSQPSIYVPAERSSGTEHSSETRLPPGRDPINIQTSSVSSPLLAGEKSFRDISKTQKKIQF
jgi:hypothetical protein